MKKPKDYFFVLLFGIVMSIQLQAQVEIGLASYYADRFHGRNTASGEKYDKDAMTAAHRTLPFGSFVLVTRLDDNSSIVVKINDRGPVSKDRIIDLSKKAAIVLGIVDEGVAKVKVELVEHTKFSASSIPVAYDEFVSKDPVVIEPKKEVIKSSTVDHSFSPSLYKLSSLGSSYGVQVASFANYSNALNQLTEFNKRSIHNVLINYENKVDGTSLYRVIIGPFNDRGSADVFYDNELKGLFRDGFVVEITQKMFVRL